MNEKELKEIYTRQYAGAGEENRLFCTKAHQAEFIVTMHYIRKYLKPGARILDVGAGTGAYAGQLAREGYTVDAMDLHPDNVSRMKEIFHDTKNVRVSQGNALDLSGMKDGTYDLVLELGPLYHLHKTEERIQAIKEAARVAKEGAPVFVAFVLQDAPLIQYIFQSEDPAYEITTIGYDRETGRVIENTGSSILCDDIKTVDRVTGLVLDKLPVSRGPRFSQDGLSQIIRDAVNGMNDASYQEWLQYLLATAERPDLMGYSNHIVQIFLSEYKGK